MKLEEFQRLESITRYGIDPALALLPRAMDSQRARHLMLAIGLQESRFLHRAQVLEGGGKGPARGFWQFERGGGVKGVMTHPATKHLAATLCAVSKVPFTRDKVWQALEHDDKLAAGFARLNLWWLPGALAGPDEVQKGWDQYYAAWRPGKPHRHTWNEFFAQAREFVYVL